MRPKKISAIILAAGESKRMHGFKPMLPLGDVTVMERAIYLFKNAGIDEVLVVVGHRAHQLIPLLEREKVHYVVNASYRDGMFSSVVCALKHLQPGCDGFFVLPVDIPLIRQYTVLELLNAYTTSCETIIYPTFKGQRGHPPLIASDFNKRILAWSGEGGLRAFLKMFESRSRDVEVADQGVLLDLDTTVDYRIMQDRCGRLDVPTEEECGALMSKVFGKQSRVAAHCAEVGRIAVQLAEALKDSGLDLDIELIRAAALLHDIARGQPGHASAGARMLADMGFLRVAEVVRVHMDLEYSEEAIGPAEIVYLADKLVEADRLVSLQERFEKKMIFFASNSEIQRLISRRLNSAFEIERRIELQLGKPLKGLLDGRF